MTRWNTLISKSTLDAETGIRIYQVSGALTGSPDSYALLERVRTEIQTAPRPTLLDLAEVEHLTSGPRVFHRCTPQLINSAAESICFGSSSRGCGYCG